MTDSSRSGAPKPVEELWCTIEGYCEAKTGHRRPVRQIARRTGLRPSTISDWFHYHSFPRWEKFSVFLSYFDEVWQIDLEIMWQAAWEAHQAARSVTNSHRGNRRSSGDDAGLSSDGPAPETRARARRRPLVGVGAALIVIVAAAYFAVRSTGVTGQHDGVARQVGSTSPAVGIVGGTCMVVTARDVRVFTSARGDEPWTSWTRDTRFWVDSDAGSTSRYRTTLRNGRHGWVTTDHRFVQPGTGCS